MDGSIYGMEDAMAIAHDGSAAERMALALRTDIAPELLYFLAEDPESQVRRAVAENQATPRQADLVLCHDSDPGVRCLLARKIVGTGLGDDQRSQLWRMGFTILETLMRDSSLRVRRTLADVIKNMFNVPHAVAHGLASDPDKRIAAPVLRHSPALTDEDLVNIVQSGAPDWAHQAIASRNQVSERVSGALVNAGATPTVTRLLKNQSADIGEPAMENIVDRAPDVEAWHEPLVKRPALPLRLAQKVSGFVSAPLKAVLAKKTDGGTETPIDRARRLHAAGKMTDAVMDLALNANERDFLMAGIALRAGVPLWGVERIVDGQSARGVTALRWKAGIPMRFAIELLRRLARIPPSKVIHARDGVDYPFSEEEMQGRLDLLLA